MKSIKNYAFFAIFLFSTLLTFAQKKTTDPCDRAGKNEDAQKVKEKIYSKIKMLGTKKLADSTITRLSKDYTTLQAEFNTMYGKMKDDIGLFTNRRKVCDNYLSQITPLVKKGEKYIDELDLAMSSPALAGSGGSDIISILDLVVTIVTKLDALGEKLTEAKKAKFYDAVKWEDWNKIK